MKTATIIKNPTITIIATIISIFDNSNSFANRIELHIGSDLIKGSSFDNGSSFYNGSRFTNSIKFTTDLIKGSFQKGSTMAWYADNGSI